MKKTPNNKPVVLGAHDMFTPENLETIIKVITAATAITSASIKALGLWLDERKSRKIKLKVRDMECEITGPISSNELQKKLQVFTNFNEKIDEKEVQVQVEEEDSPAK